MNTAAPHDVAVTANLCERDSGDNALMLALATVLQAGVVDWNDEQIGAFTHALTPAGGAFLYHHFGGCYRRLDDALRASMGNEQLSALIEDRRWKWERAQAATQTANTRWDPRSSAPLPPSESVSPESFVSLLRSSMTDPNDAQARSAMQRKILAARDWDNQACSEARRVLSPHEVAFFDFLAERLQPEQRIACAELRRSLSQELTADDLGRLMAENIARARGLA